MTNMRNESEQLAAKIAEGAFMQGYAWAVANLQRLNGGRELTAEVQHLMREAGPLLASPWEARAAGVDEQDIHVLFPA